MAAGRPIELRGGGQIVRPRYTTKRKGEIIVKISALIAELEAAKAEFGDLEVYKGIAPYFERVFESRTDWVEGEDALVRVLAL